VSETSVSTSRAEAVSVDQLHAVSKRQKEQLKQQESVMVAREQRLQYLQQQHRQQQQVRRLRYDGQMCDIRLNELRASTFGNRLQRRSDSCKSSSRLGITLHHDGRLVYAKIQIKSSSSVLQCQ